MPLQIGFCSLQIGFRIHYSINIIIFSVEAVRDMILLNIIHLERKLIDNKMQISKC